MSALNETEDENVKYEYKLFVLNSGTTVAKPINSVSDTIINFAFDKNNNVLYLATKINGIFLLKDATSTPVKIKFLDLVWRKIFFVNNDVYFVFSDYLHKMHLIWVLTKVEIENDEPIAKKINGITDYNLEKGSYLNFILSDKNNNVYFATTDGLFKMGNDNQIAKILIDVNLFDKQKNINYLDWSLNNFDFLVALVSNKDLLLNNVHDTDYYFWVNNAVIGNDNNIYCFFHNKFYILNSKKITREIKGLPNDYLDIKEIIINQDGDIYFILRTDYCNNNVYFLAKNSDTCKQINFNRNSLIINSLIISSENNIYIETNSEIFMIKPRFSLYIDILQINLKSNNEIFEKWYKFLASDELKVRFNFYTVNEIVNLFSNFNKADFISIMKRKIGMMKRTNYSQTWSEITETDINIISNIIYDDFFDIYYRYQKMTFEDEIILVTNTSGYWPEYYVTNNKIFKFT